MYITATYETQNFINRELSWLEFNGRVLREAASSRNPIMERLKFLAIVSSNLDEFFMIRVASLRDMVQAGYTRPDPSGMTPSEQIAAISMVCHRMVARQYAVLNRIIAPKLRELGLYALRPSELNSCRRAEATMYFEHNIYPVLTPMAADASRPFPLILSRSLNIGVLVRDGDDLDGEPQFATVQVPSMVSRIVSFSGGAHNFMLLEDIIMMHIDRLFSGRKVLACAAYRITRNADLTIEEEDASDLLREIEKSLKRRKWGAVIRLELDASADPRLREALMEALEIGEEEVYGIKGPLNLDFLMKIYGMPGLNKLKYPPYAPVTPAWAEGDDFFAAIRLRDRLLYVPYQSFNPVLRMLREAASDPNVLAIKQTLYRVSGDSPVVRALEEAAEAGKQVTVMLEVKARFDEENNIQWGKKLERAGCHVVYGLPGLKTHAKVTLIVRREEDGIRRYVHLSTGNYNDVTARLYTDHSIFTCNEQFGADASAFFNMLTGYAKSSSFNHFIMAPDHMRERFLDMIAREARNARQGLPASILAKMNSLVDSDVIRALYDASTAGVQVRLIVRGICCLRPGVPGVSENIRVRSIVSRFLEHSRIFRFENGGRGDVFLSSADWMPRNLDRRVEVLFPVLDEQSKGELAGLMELQWRDNTKARELQSSGWYTLAETGEEGEVNAQEASIAALGEGGL